MDLFINFKKGNKGNLVPRKITINKDGKTFQQTFWVNPNKGETDTIGKLNECMQSGNKEAAMKEAKKLGITWKESEHPGVNWMRAAMAINKRLNPQKPKSEKLLELINEYNSTPSEKLKGSIYRLAKELGNKEVMSKFSLSKVIEDAKKLGGSSLEGLVRSGNKEAAMKEAKKLGITWKENDSPGINWMRAATAIKKHLSGELIKQESLKGASPNLKHELDQSKKQLAQGAKKSEILDMRSPAPTMDDLNIKSMLKSVSYSQMFKPENVINPIFARVLRFSKYPARLMTYIQSKGWDSKFGSPIDKDCKLNIGDIVLEYDSVICIVDAEPTEPDGKFIVKKVHLNNWDDTNNSPYVEAHICGLSNLNSMYEGIIGIDEPVDVSEVCRFVSVELSEIITDATKCEVKGEYNLIKVSLLVDYEEYSHKSWFERFESRIWDLKQELRKMGLILQLTLNRKVQNCVDELVVTRYV